MLEGIAMGPPQGGITNIPIGGGNWSGARPVATQRLRKKPAKDEEEAEETEPDNEQGEE